MVQTRRQLLAEVQVLRARTGATETRKSLRERVSRLTEERKQLEERAKSAEKRSAALLLECEALKARLAEQTAAPVSNAEGPNG